MIFYLSENFIHQKSKGILATCMYFFLFREIHYLLVMCCDCLKLPFFLICVTCLRCEKDFCQQINIIDVMEDLYVLAITFL